MNITKEKCEEFKDLVEGLIRRYSSPTGVVYYTSLLPAFLEYAAQISENHIPSRFIHGDNTTRVNSSQFDFNILMMSIMSVCWAVRMRKKKSDEGQCQEHITNCNDARIFHRERYDEWISLVEEALEALKSDRP